MGHPALSSSIEEIRCPHRSYFVLSMVLLATLVCLAPALAGRDAGRKRRKVDPALEALLQRLDEAQESLNSLTADLEEVRTLELLSEPQRFRGHLAYQKPGRIRWEYQSPEERIYVLENGELKGWLPAKNRLEKVDLHRHEKRLRRLVGLGQDTAALKKEFELTLLDAGDARTPAQLELVPRSRRVRKRVRKVRLWIDPELSLPVRIEYETGSGDKILVKLNHLQVNPTLAASTFSLTIPPGAEIVEGKSSFGIGGSGVSR